MFKCNPLKHDDSRHRFDHTGISAKHSITQGIREIEKVKLIKCKRCGTRAWMRANQSGWLIHEVPNSVDAAVNYDRGDPRL